MSKLSHVDSSGGARMVDVGEKPTTTRRAVASAFLALSRETLELLFQDRLPKGDALAVARITGIQGAKRTSSLIPLCHPIPLDHIGIDLRREADGVRILAAVRTRAPTGVEMEALTGAATAALGLIDMVKGVERGAVLRDLRIELKEGGRSGRWVRDGFDEGGEPAEDDA